MSDAKIHPLVNFSDPLYPQSICDKIFEYLIGECPFEDAIVLTCKEFQYITYHHYSFMNRFHLRLQPSWPFKASNKYKLQIGSNITEASKRAVIISGIDETVLPCMNSFTNDKDSQKSSEKKRNYFDFRQLRVYNIQQQTRLCDIIPFFYYFQPYIRFMSWNDPQFLRENKALNLTTAQKVRYLKLAKEHGNASDDNKNDKEEKPAAASAAAATATATNKEILKEFDSKYDFPPIMDKCELITMLLTWKCKWYDDKKTGNSINLDGKFPNLICLQLQIETEKLISKIQSFLNHTPKLSILLVNFQFSKNIVKDKDFKPITLTLPKSIEILVLFCSNEESAQAVKLDYSRCKDNLKYVSAVYKSFHLMLPILQIDPNSNNTSNNNNNNNNDNNSENNSSNNENKEQSKIGMDIDKNEFPKLKYITIVDRNDIMKFKGDVGPWNSILANESVGCKFFTPALPHFSQGIWKGYLPHWPNLDQVKNNLVSLGGRQMLRDLNCEQKRYYLWGIFWHDKIDCGPLEELRKKWDEEDRLMQQ